MEEILASIRRIIAEDEKPTEPTAPAAPTGKPDLLEKPDTLEKPDVLELTQALNEDGSVGSIAAAPADAPIAGPAEARIEPDPPRQTMPEQDFDQGPSLPRADGLVEPLPMSDSERILSSASSGAAAAAFARLAGMPRERRQGDMLLGAADRTLEELVREVLRPLLQVWLDDNLPDLVERLVRAEISRVVGEAGLR